MLFLSKMQSPSVKNISKNNFVWCFFVFLLCCLFRMEYVLLATVKRESIQISSNRLLWN